MSLDIHFRKLITNLDSPFNSHFVLYVVTQLLGGNVSRLLEDSKEKVIWKPVHVQKVTFYFFPQRATKPNDVYTTTMELRA